jgi:hypothetical protein
MTCRAVCVHLGHDSALLAAELKLRQLSHMHGCSGLYRLRFCCQGSGPVDGGALLISTAASDKESL